MAGDLLKTIPMLNEIAVLFSNFYLHTLLSDHGGTLSLGGRDASIVAMMKRQKVNTILTHDRDFKKLEDDTYGNTTDE